MAGGQLRWVSLLDPGKGVAILTPVLRPQATPAPCALQVAWLGGLCESLHPFVWKMVAALLQSSCVTENKNRQSAWCLAARPQGLQCPRGGWPEAPLQQVPGAMDPQNPGAANCRGPAAGRWGAWCPGNQPRVRVRTQATHACSLTFWWLSPAKEAHSLGLAPLGLAAEGF